VRIFKLISVLFVFSLIFVGVSAQVEINGTYEKIEDNKYEVIVYLPSTHTSFSIEEIGMTFDTISTNKLNLTLNENDIIKLDEEITILADEKVEYIINLTKISHNENTQLLENILVVFLGLSLLTGTSFLVIIPKDKIIP
jgi:hypothetical protein